MSQECNINTLHKGDDDDDDDDNNNNINALIFIYPGVTIILSAFFFAFFFVNSFSVLGTFLDLTVLRPAPLHFTVVCQKTLSSISPSL